MEGGICGLWGWMMADFSVEGTQIKCEGRNDDECRSVCTTDKMFNQRKITFIKYNNKIECDSATKEYLAYNSIRPIKFSNSCMKKLIDGNIVAYDKGKIEYNGERYFPLSIDFLFILESQIKKLQGADKILFQTAFQSGIRIAKKERTIDLKFISDLVSSHGWGDLYIEDNLQNIIITYYPWHQLIKECKFEIFLGLLSGLVSSYKNREIYLKFKKISFEGGLVSFNMEYSYEK